MLRSQNIRSTLQLFRSSTAGTMLSEQPLNRRWRPGCAVSRVNQQRVDRTKQQEEEWRFSEHVEQSLFKEFVPLAKHPI